MKRCVLILTTSLWIGISLSYSQEAQIPNSDFEQWQQNHYNSSYPDLFYWEMLPLDIWANGNAATTITGEFPTQRSEDAYEGDYAAKLETMKVFGVIASGNLFTGEFVSDLFDSQALRGVPFTDKPIRFSGYYKYIPGTYKSAKGIRTTDKCAIYAILSKWNGTARDTVAIAKMESDATISSYTLFDFPFDYHSQETPDTISIVFASSAGGENFEGAEGSTLYVDNINLEYENSIVVREMKNEARIEVRYLQNQKILKAWHKRSEPLRISLYNQFGRLITGTTWEREPHIHLGEFPQAMYIYQISSRNGQSVSGKCYAY